jgi:hypothetical protein
MSYGEIKIDTITFTAGGVDASVSVSGLVQNPTFTGNITTTGTISGDVIKGNTISGATVTGDTGEFGNLTAVSGVFTTQVSGATVTGNVGLFGTITGGIHTLTSGVFASGTAENPSITFVGDLDSGIYLSAANEVAISTSGTGRLFVDSDGNVGIGSASPDTLLHLSSATGTATPTPTELRIATTSNGSDWSTTDPWGRISFYSADGSNNGPKTHATIDTIAQGAAGGHSALRFAVADLTTTLYEGMRFECTGTTGQTFATISTSGDERLRLTATGEFEFTGAGTAGITQAVYFNGSAPVNSLVVDANGKVGIGQTPPDATYELHVQGDIRSTGNLRVEGNQIRVTGTSSAASPSIQPGNDGDTGIFHETNTLGFSTFGEERLRIDSTGNVGIGNNSPDSLLHLSANNSAISDFTLAKNLLRLEDTDTTQSNGQITGGIIFEGQDADAAGIQSAIVATTNSGTGGGKLLFYTADSGSTLSGASAPRLLIDGSGNLGLGTSSPDALFKLEAAAGADIRLEGSSGCSNYIYFAEAGYDYFRIHHNGSGTNPNNLLQIQCANGNDGVIDVDAVTITQAGRVGIGTTSPSSLLDLSAGYASITWNSDDWRLRFRRTDGSFTGGIKHNGFGDMSFWTADDERARIDSNGRLLVGTSSSKTISSYSNALLQVKQDNSSTQAAFSAVAYGGAGTTFPRILLSRANGTEAAPTAAIENTNMGYIQFHGYDGTGFIPSAFISASVDGTPGANDMPGRLVFSTTADGASSPTERLRIANQGTSDFLASSVTAIRAANTAAAGTSVPNFIGRYGATTPQTGTNSFIVWTNGDVNNTNNVYASISDIKLKENIVDASSQWDDLKALQVRNYNFKEGQTHTQIGLVAQEVELVSPGLVSESPDRDEDGNDLGTVTKSVNYSVLYMKAVKALQEAMERIETLEQRLNDAGIA